MTILAKIALALGLIMAGMYLPMVIVPRKALGWARKFPRNRLAGWLFTAVAVLWSARLLFDIPLGFFDDYKSLLYILAPVLFILVVLCMDELLAARALGAVLVLVPTPILEAARWHESQFRYVMIVVAYIMAIKGMILLFSPYKFRKSIERFIKTERVCRIYGAIGLLLACSIIALAVFVY